MDWSSIPWWVWVLLAAAVVIVVPIKLRVLKSLLKKQAEQNRPIEDE